MISEKVLIFIMICFSCACAKMGTVETSRIIKDEELAQVYSLWATKNTAEEIFKKFGKESKIVTQDGQEQIIYLNESLLPKMVFEIGKDRKIISVYYAPEKLSVDKLKFTLPCRQWALRIEKTEKKDLMVNAHILVCTNETIQVELKNDASNVQELWLGGGQ